jgi:hypothetical protein
MVIINVMAVFARIITIECSVVARLYVWSEASANMWRSTFEPNKSGVSELGQRHVLRKVGIKAVTSIATAIQTETVGSFVRSQGINPKRARMRKNVSLLVMPFVPYLRDSRKMMGVKISEASVGNAPIPAPLAIWPNKIMAETIDHTNHV